MSESVSELKACPCGEIPKELIIIEELSGKWINACGDCCSEWSIETRNNYDKGEFKIKNAVDAWNESPRTPSRNDVIDECVETLRPFVIFDCSGKEYTPEQALESIKKSDNG